MSSRFRPGGAVYAKDGRRYIVEEVEDGMVYCVSDGGAETEFAEAQLLNEAEWLARSGNKTDRLYGTIKQSKYYAPYRGRLNRADAERLLAKVERLSPGMLDYTSFVSAERILGEAGMAAAVPELSIVKCREIFDAAPVENRAALLAGLIGRPPDVLVGTVDMGENLLRAMIDKATTAGSISFDEFRTRRRK